MDPRAFDVLLRTVRAELTPEQCRALARVAGEALDRRGVGQLIEAKSRAMGRDRRCPRCDGNWVIKWGFNKNWAGSASSAATVSGTSTR